MKKTFSICLALSTGAALLQLLPYSAQGSELLTRPATAETNGARRVQRSVSASFVGLKAGKSPVQDSRERPAPAVSTEPAHYPQPKKAVLLSPAAKGTGKLSPPFQVSPDVRDQVQLSISNGIVTVQGSVGSRELAQKLLRQFGQIAGVHEVRNRLIVRTNRDLEIAAKLREAFSRDETTRAAAIGVTVYKGNVFLSGTALSDAESARADELASTTPGVIKVNNGLHIAVTSRSPARLTTTTRRYPPRAR